MADRPLCRLADIADGGARGLTIDAVDGPTDIMVIRRGETVVAYVNSCPHVGTPLDWAPDTFLDPSGKHIQCSTHGALFRIGDGHCFAGPCVGDALEAVHVRVRNGDVVFLDGT